MSDPGGRPTRDPSRWQEAELIQPLSAETGPPAGGGGRVIAWAALAALVFGLALLIGLSTATHNEERRTAPEANLDVGAGLLRSSVFSADPALHDIRWVQRGELDPAPGPEIAVVVRDQVLYLDDHGRVKTRLRLPAGEHFGEGVQLVRQPGGCDFLESGQEGFRLRSHDGRVRWRRVAAGGRLESCAVGDVDGQGTDAILFGDGMAGRLERVGLDGRRLWRVTDQALLQPLVAEGGGRHYIVTNGTLDLRLLDARGVYQPRSFPDGEDLNPPVAVCPFPTRDSAACALLVNSGMGQHQPELSLCSLDGVCRLRVRLPGAPEYGGLSATLVRPWPDRPDYLALATWDKTALRLYLYDTGGNLVVTTTLASDGFVPQLTVVPGGPGQGERLLVGTKGRLLAWSAAGAPPPRRRPVPPPQPRRKRRQLANDPFLLPPELVRGGPFRGAGRFREDVLFDDPTLGSVIRVQRGDLDPAPGPELGVLGARQAVYLDDAGRVKARDVLPRGDTFDERACFVRTTDGACGYLDADRMTGAVLGRVHDGRVLWRRQGPTPVRGLATGDLDGRGSDAMVCSYHGGGLDRLSPAGEVQWHVDAPWTTVAVASDPAWRGVGYVDLGRLALLDAAGRPQSMADTWWQWLSFSPNLCLLGQDAGGPLAVGIDADTKDQPTSIAGVDRAGQRRMRREAPLLRDHLGGPVEATRCRLKPGEPAYLAVATERHAPDREGRPRERVIVYLYDAQGGLAYATSVAGQNPTLAAVPRADGQGERLLIGGEGKVLALSAP